MAVIGIFKRAIQFNPYPTKWKLPGDNTASKQHLEKIEGNARMSIAHSLTFHELPSNIDNVLDKLPQEKELQALNPLRQNYLSFTVLSLKQMVAVGTISADIAWSVFYGEWGKINEVQEGNFAGMRRTFVEGIFTGLSKEINQGCFEEISNEYFKDEKGTVDLLKFEFVARAGEAGLVGYARYSEWAQRVEVLEHAEITWDDYCKAVWLGMRIIEQKAGLGKLNEEIEVIARRPYAVCDVYHRKIEFCVDLFLVGAGSASSVDSSLFAELGHWLWTHFIATQNKWAIEIGDRLCHENYTARVNHCFVDGKIIENSPPEGRVFWEGGFFSINDEYELVRGLDFRNDSWLPELNPEVHFSSYPSSAPAHPVNEAHFVAERINRQIRDIIRADYERGPATKALRLYWQFNAYYLLMTLEQKTVSLTELKKDDVARQAASAKERALVVWRSVFKNSQSSIEKCKAADAIISLSAIDKKSEEYKILYAYKLCLRFLLFIEFREDIKKGIQKEARTLHQLQALGDSAGPALRAISEDDRWEVRLIHDRLMEALQS